MTMLPPTAHPVRPFLDWPVVTDPAGWTADVALLGIQHSEPYAHDPRPNDQSRAPDAIRWQSQRFCYAPENWDFDTGTDLAAVLPPRHLDLGNVAWTEGPYDDYAAEITDRVRHLWRNGTQVEAARAYGSRLVTAEQFHADGPDSVIATIPEGRAVYLTIDADGLDPTEMPAVMAPTPGGLYFRELAPLLRAVARSHRIVGMDLVEVAPSFDFANGLTCITARRLILNVLGASWGTDGACRREARTAAGEP